MDREKFLSGFLYWGAVAVCLVLFFRFLLPSLLPFIFGGLLALLLRPFARAIRQITRMAYKPSAFLAALLFFAGSSILLWWLGSLLLYQASGFFSRLPQIYLDTLQPALVHLSTLALDFLASLSPDASRQMEGMAATLGQTIQNFLAGASAAVLGAIGDAATHLPAILVALSFSILSTFFIVMDYSLVAGFVRRQLPDRLYRPVRDGADFLAVTGKNVIKAYFLLMVITFSEVSLGLCLLRVEYYLVAGLLVAVLDILPVIGSGLVLLPWGIYLVLAEQLPRGIGVLLLWGVVTLARTFMEPKILGDRIGLHPLVTIVSMYLGMQLAGVGGLIFAPVTVTVLIYLNHQGHVRLFR